MLMTMQPPLLYFTEFESKHNKLSLTHISSSIIYGQILPGIGKTLTDTVFCNVRIQLIGSDMTSESSFVSKVGTRLTLLLILEKSILRFIAMVMNTQEAA